MSLRETLALRVELRFSSLSLAVQRERAIVHQREVAQARYDAARGNLAGQSMREAGLIPGYVWRQNANAYEVAQQRQWGVDGFANRGSRKAAARYLRHAKLWADYRNYRRSTLPEWREAWYKHGG